MKALYDAKVLHYLDFIVKNVTLGSLLASVKQIARIRNRPEGVVRNEISAGRCPIPTFIDEGRRVATVFACAEWLANKEEDIPVAGMKGSPTPRRRGRPHKTDLSLRGGAK